MKEEHFSNFTGLCFHRKRDQKTNSIKTFTSFFHKKSSAQLLNKWHVFLSLFTLLATGNTPTIVHTIFLFHSHIFLCIHITWKLRKKSRCLIYCLLFSYSSVGGEDKCDKSSYFEGVWWEKKSFFITSSHILFEV